MGFQKAFCAAALLLCSIVLIIGCDQSETGTSSANRNGSSMSAVVPENTHQPPLPEILISPSGQRIIAGTVADNGAVLPLDVLALDRSVETEQPTHSTGTRATDKVRDRGDSQAGSWRESDFEEYRISPLDGHTQNETTIDVMDGTLIAGWNQFTSSSLVMGYARSSDSGHSWVSNTFSGHSMTSDPTVKSGGDGVWYYGYLASSGPGGSDIDIYLRRSTDDGLSWSNPIDVSQNNSFDDKPYIDAVGNHIVAAWADFGYSPARVSAAVSDDGGLSFSHHSVLADHSIGGNGACPVIGPEGNDYVFWRGSYQDSLWLSRSLDGGLTWSQDRGIAGMNPLPSSFPPGYRIVNLPSAAANPVTGDLLVVWNDQCFGNPDILAIRSTDAGLSWSAPIRVNDDPGAEAQFFPWITFDDNGVAHIVWYDKREDGYSIDVYYTRSTDSGLSFEPNQRVTGEAFTPVLPWEPSSAFIGDYNGIAVDTEHAYPCYQDSRDGNQDVYVAMIPNGSSELPESAGGEPQNENQLSASPNPFRSGTRLSWGMRNLPRTASVEIIAVSGRMVRRLACGANGVVDWDGRDMDGAEVATGIYYARLTGVKASERRLVRVR